MDTWAIEAVLCDVDDTLIVGYMGRPNKEYDPIEVLSGVQERLVELQQAGIKLGLVSNQGAVAFGMITEEQAKRKLAGVVAALGLPKNTPIAACFSDVRGRPPWNDPADAARRKPSGAMILEVLAELSVAPEHALFVGDRPEDAQAAAAAGCAFQWATDFFAPEGSRA